MRDRLIELIDNAFVDFIDFANQNPAEKTSTEFIADYLLDNGVIVLPVKVGDKFYKVERWCTEGGYWDKPRYAYSSTCEDCCEKCDGVDEIIEYTFNSPQHILSLERQFGKYVFLTREDAEKALRGGEDK